MAATRNEIRNELQPLWSIGEELYRRRMTPSPETRRLDAERELFHDAKFALRELLGWPPQGRPGR